MALENGKIPDSYLVKISGGNVSADCDPRLRKGAAASWETIYAELKKLRWPARVVNDGYRDFARQQRYKNNGMSNVTPGKSNHGWGLAVDVDGLGGFNSAKFNTFAAIAKPKSWNNDEGKSIGEPWHWVYTGEPDKVGGSVAPSPPPPPPGKLTEDGVFGTETVKRWQQVMGTVADGIISGQFTGNKQYHQASAALQYGSGGSSLVRAVQQKLGITADGHLGPNTIKAIQKRLGVTADGYFAAKPSETVKALQRKLNTGTF
ncbi:MAG: hypothetical protein FWF12_04455 [Betaproteobacteria bacterium]|nr:hypothetical protein [Betaproteobacteria bacterium]